jgi:hypothetical protein
MKNRTWVNSPKSGSRYAWTRIKNVNGASRLSNVRNFFFWSYPNDFLSRLVTMDETWLYHYDRRQSNNQWRGGIAADLTPPQKNSERKYPLKVLVSIFGINTAFSLLIIFQRVKLSKRSITHFRWCNRRIFRRKNTARGKETKGSCSCTKMSRFTEHLRPSKNWPTLASIILTTYDIHRVWPRRTTTCSLDWKTQLKSRHFFRSEGNWCRGDLVAGINVWIF